MAKDHKLVELEALRGIAAIVVCLHHFLLVFLPATALTGVKTPFWIFFNGQAAVAFFFVLSGFVLPLGLLSKPDLTSAVLWACLRRWPRLAMPSLLTCLASSALIGFGLYFHKEVAELTGSAWLMGRMSPSAAGPFDAILEALFGVFLTSESHFNMVLWTMFYEFWGSILVFASVPIVRAFSLRLSIAGLAIEALLVYFANPYMACFVMGLLLAVIYTSRRDLIDKAAVPVVRCFALLLIIVFGSFTEPVGFHAWLAPFVSGFGWHGVFVVVHTTLAVLAICLALTTKGNLLRSETARLLGRLSFPLYLSHMLVICSVSSFLYASLSQSLPSEAVIPFVFLVTAAILMGVSLPLAWCDKWLVQGLQGLSSAIKRVANCASTSPVPMPSGRS